MTREERKDFEIRALAEHIKSLAHKFDIHIYIIYAMDSARIVGITKHMKEVHQVQRMMDRLCKKYDDIGTMSMFCFGADDSYTSIIIDGRMMDR